MCKTPTRLEGLPADLRTIIVEEAARAEDANLAYSIDLLAKTYKIAEAMPTQYSSTAQDLARGKPTEIDHLNGYVVRQGTALGIFGAGNTGALMALKFAPAKEHVLRLIRFKDRMTVTFNEQKVFDDISMPAITKSNFLGIATWNKATGLDDLTVYKLAEK